LRQSSSVSAGLLPGAGLEVASVFSADSAGIPIADAVALLGGLDWLVGSGPRVINMSFAGDSNTLVALALRMIDGRAIVVAAVGNEGPTAPPAFPAAEPGVIGRNGRRLRDLVFSIGRSFGRLLEQEKRPRTCGGSADRPQH
jgi:subtilisin family serine protease